MKKGEKGQPAKLKDSIRDKERE